MTLFNFIINTFSAALNHATAQPNVANLHALIDHAVAQQKHSPQQSPGTTYPSPHQPQPPHHNHKVPSPTQSCPQFQPLPVTNPVKSDLDKSSVNCASLEEHTVEILHRKFHLLVDEGYLSMPLLLLVARAPRDQPVYNQLALHPR